MRGHVAKKGNRYYAVVYEGVDRVTHKPRHRWYAGGRTRKEAERVLADLVKRQHDGDYRAPERITLGDYLIDRWLPTKRSQLRPSTFDSYERNIQNHVIPRLGSVALQRLTPEDLDRFYADLLADGRLNGAGGGLSAKSVRYIHGILRKALSDAHRKGSVVRNVADLADPPKPSAGGRKTEMRAWTAEELRQFLDEIASHRLGPAFFVAANTGMRRGEVLGLRWRDIDLDGARLSVQQALVNVAYEPQLADVKTPTSRRSIDLDERTVIVLRTWRKKQLEEQLLVGRRSDEDAVVFAQPDGSPVHPDYFSQVFERHVARSELPRIRLHDLRHTHATILLKAGVPVKVVSERLGHASPAFTMSVYQHVLPGMQADAAAAFSSAVFGG
ncbi:MAG: site-specific integrase [Acidimicrobiia bacterium]